MRLGALVIALQIADCGLQIGLPILPQFINQSAINNLQSAIPLASDERARVLSSANLYLTRLPETITASRAARSAGGLHDLFSEGDYWWPDPAHPDGPYIRRDGESNPDNFADHRRALVRFSVEEVVRNFFIRQPLLWID